MDNLTLAYILIALGIVLLAAELFIPTGGVLFILAAGAVIAGVALTFTYGEPYIGILTLIGVFVAIPAVAAGLMYLWPRSPMGRRTLTPNEEDHTVAQMRGNAELEQLRGRIGRAVSPLRPSGVVDFDGRRVDCMTEGMMVPADAWVRCIDVRAGKVVVRQIEQPNLEDLETTDFQ